eukprot:3941056-Rhodomonas_salina.1
MSSSGTHTHTHTPLSRPLPASLSLFLFTLLPHMLRSQQHLWWRCCHFWLQFTHTHGGGADMFVAGRDIALVCIGAVGLGLLNGTEGTPDGTPSLSSLPSLLSSCSLPLLPSLPSLSLLPLVPLVPSLVPSLPSPPLLRSLRPPALARWLVSRRCSHCL